MHLPPILIPVISTLASAATIPLVAQQPLNSLPQSSSNAEISSFRIPTLHESAIMARRMLHKEGIATLSTIFPSPHDNDHDSLSTLETRPADVAGLPFALIEYFADCEPETGNPTILAVDLATTFKNSRAGSNVTMSLRWHPPAWEQGTYSPARLPRYSLLGYLEEMDEETVAARDVKKCFLNTHRDVIWAPGNDIHTSRWTRFVVREVYWFGGFGDRARIEWIPLEEWQGVTREEIANCRLPGDESKSSEWFRWLMGDADVAKHKNSCPANY